ncbi:hypothetical protein [Streptomyces platensis]|uniref:hypothetical protein n=1 Tax=Streptomyces platensis TaxID=58346 RepID=UPI00367D5822
MTLRWHGAERRPCVVRQRVEFLLRLGALSGAGVPARAADEGPPDSVPVRLSA